MTTNEHFSGVVEVMNDYLAAAVDAVCNSDAVHAALGDFDSLSDRDLLDAFVPLVAAYLNGCVRLHQGAIERGQRARIEGGAV